MSTDTSQFDGTAYLNRAAAFDAKTITDALALAGATGYAEQRAVIAGLPGFQNAEISNDRLTATALGILSEYTRQIVTMYQRAEARVAELEAEHACQHGTTCIGPECDRA